MQPCPYPIEDILFHAPPMILIDEVEGYDEETVISSVTIRDTSPFLEDGVLPSYVGIEYMAQSIAAYSGIKARNQGGDVKIGYLVSARNLTLETPNFKIGDKLEITVQLVYNEVPMAVFDCAITKNKALVAKARVNVYQP